MMYRHADREQREVLNGLTAAKSKSYVLAAVGTASNSGAGAASKSTFTVIEGARQPHVAASVVRCANVWQIASSIKWGGASNAQAAIAWSDGALAV